MVAPLRKPETLEDIQKDMQKIHPRFNKWDTALHKMGMNNLGYDLAVWGVKKAVEVTDHLTDAKMLTDEQKQNVADKYGLELKGEVSVGQLSVLRWRQQQEQEFKAQLERTHASQRFSMLGEVGIGLAGGLSDVVVLAGAAAIDIAATKGLATAGVWGLRASRAAIGAAKVAKVVSKMSKFAAPARVMTSMATLGASGGLAGYLEGKSLEYTHGELGLEYDKRHTADAIGMGVFAGSLVGMGRGLVPKSRKAQLANAESKADFTAMVNGKKPSTTVKTGIVKAMDTPPELKISQMDVPAKMDEGIHFAAFNGKARKMGLNKQQSFGKTFGKGLMLTTDYVSAKSAASHALNKADGLVVKMSLKGAKLMDTALELSTGIKKGIWREMKKHDPEDLIHSTWQKELKSINDFNKMADLMPTKAGKELVQEAINKIMKRKGYDGYSDMGQRGMNTFLFDPKRAKAIKKSAEIVPREKTMPKVDKLAKEFDEYLDDATNDIAISSAQKKYIKEQLAKKPEVSRVEIAAGTTSKEYKALVEGYESLKKLSEEIKKSDEVAKLKKAGREVEQISKELSETEQIGMRLAADRANKFLNKHRKTFSEEDTMKTIQDLANCVLGL